MLARNAYSKLLSGQTCLWSSRETHPILAAAAQQILPVRYKKRIKYRPKPMSRKRAKWKAKQAAIIERTKSQTSTKEDDAELMSRVPEDDVWIGKYYANPKLRFSEALAWIREAACPEMEDNMEELLWLKCQLNMSTKKKTKFSAGFVFTEVAPHLFDDGTVNKVLALCKTNEDREAAREAGAELVGGQDLIHRIQNQEINVKEYTNIVSSMDMLTEITSIRKYLKDVFPSKSKGTLGEDVGEMVRRFCLGKELVASRDSENVGHIELPVGQLDMDEDQLRENLQHFVNAIYRFKKNPVGPFIRRGFLICPPSSFMIELDGCELTSTESKKTKKVIQEEDEDEEQHESVAEAN